MTFFGKSDIIIGGMDLGIHALLSTLYWGGFLVGRAISSFFSKISAKTQLTVTTLLATILAVISMLTQNLWYLVAIGLLHSTMWSCIFSCYKRFGQIYFQSIRCIHICCFRRSCIHSDTGRTCRYIWLMEMDMVSHCYMRVTHAFLCTFRLRIRPKDIIQ